MRVDSVTQLQSLKKWRSRRGITGIELRISGPPQSEIAESERLINKELQACGCEISALFVVVGALFLAFTKVREFVVHPFGWPSGVRIFLYLVALGLVGKVLGLVVAEYRLRSALKRCIKLAVSAHSELASR